MNIRHVVSLSVAAVAASVSLSAQTLPLPRGKPEDAGMSSPRLNVIATTLKADVEHGRIPGAVIAIARRGKIVYFEAFGYRDKAAAAPMTIDAIFNIASMTKPITAVAALQLYEQGRILIDDPLSAYVPAFGGAQVAVMDDKQQAIVGKVPVARPITIQDLMRHTSGLIYGDRGATAVHKLYPGGSTGPASTMTGAEFLGLMSRLPLLHQPGAVWDYGYGLDVLGLVVEKIAGQTLGEYEQAHVFAPLGMTDTAFMVPAAKIGRYAKALPNDPDTGAPQSLLALTQPLKFECGGGCLTSTASDYLRFALMLMHGGAGEPNGAHVLGRKTVEYMLSNQLGPEVKNLIGNADPTREGYGFGLGLAVRTTPGAVRLMGSVGDYSWPGASGTNWWADPKEDLAVVFMAQSPGPIRWHYRQLINALVYQAIVD
jgi:CubicO group peptidase (beta-lactamase class C family)